MLIRSKKTSILFVGAWSALILVRNLCAQQAGPTPAPSAPENNQWLQRRDLALRRPLPLER
jgi:hypothetical protein